MIDSVRGWCSRPVAGARRNDGHHNGAGDDGKKDDSDCCAADAAEIYRPADTETFGHEHRWVVAVDVEETGLPIPVIVGRIGPTFAGRCAPGCDRLPVAHYEDDQNGKQESQQRNDTCCDAPTAAGQHPAGNSKPSDLDSQNDRNLT